MDPVRTAWTAGLAGLQVMYFEGDGRGQLWNRPSSATARPRSRRWRRERQRPFITERFRLITGREVGVTFSRLNDAEDQAARFPSPGLEQGRRRRQGDVLRPRLRARARAWHAAGRRCGIGIDRLIMLLTDSPSIRDVVLFPALRREG